MNYYIINEIETNYWFNATFDSREDALSGLIDMCYELELDSDDYSVIKMQDY